MKELISIIIPVYNVENYIRKCLDSVISQTYSNIEILLVDDGSTDHSGKICDEYEAKNEKIKVIHTNNRGVSTARNVGLKHAAGKYICFVDADDWLEDNMVEILYEILDITKADFSVCGMINEYPGKGNRERIKKQSYDYEELYGKTIFKWLIDEKNFYGYVWNKLFRKGLSEDIKFDENLFLCEDMDYVTRYAVKAKRAVYTSAELYHYRHQRESITGDFSYSARKVSLLNAYEKIISLYEQYCEEYVYKLYRNYLKIAINIKGRMILSRISDKAVEHRIENIICKYYPIVIKSNKLTWVTKCNILLTRRFPGVVLWIKQKILQIRISD